MGKRQTVRTKVRSLVLLLYTLRLTVLIMQLKLKWKHTRAMVCTICNVQTDSLPKDKTLKHTTPASDLVIKVVIGYFSTERKHKVARAESSGCLPLVCMTLLQEHMVTDQARRNICSSTHGAAGACHHAVTVGKPA